MDRFQKLPQSSNRRGPHVSKAARADRLGDMGIFRPQQPLHSELHTQGLVDIPNRHHEQHNRHDNHHQEDPGAWTDFRLVNS